MVEFNEDRPIRVLLVDDHTVVRQGTRSALETTTDIKVIAEAEDGQRALDMAVRLRPDVMLLDIRLKGMSGIEVAKQARALLPDTKVLVFSAFDMDPYVKIMLAIGVHGYLTKDVSTEDLVEAVRRVVHGGTILGPEVAAKVVHMMSANGGVRLPNGEELTGREWEVLQLIAEGLRNTQIAEKLNVAIRTVEGYSGSITEKLQAPTRLDVVTKAYQWGLVVMER